MLPKQRSEVDTHQSHTGSNLPQETQMSRNKAASYTQVSSDSQQSVMEQIERIRRFADEHGHRVAREYEDERDGGTTADRAGFQKIMADALSAERPFDTIIVYDLSRFSASSSDLTRYRDHPRGRNQAAQCHGTRQALPRRVQRRHGTIGRRVSGN